MIVNHRCQRNRANSDFWHFTWAISWQSTGSATVIHWPEGLYYINQKSWRMIFLILQLFIKYLPFAGKTSPHEKKILHSILLFLCKRKARTRFLRDSGEPVIISSAISALSLERYACASGADSHCHKHSVQIMYESAESRPFCQGFTCREKNRDTPRLFYCAVMVDAGYALVSPVWYAIGLPWTFFLKVSVDKRWAPCICQTKGQAGKTKKRTVQEKDTSFTIG